MEDDKQGTERMVTDRITTCNGSADGCTMGSSIISTQLYCAIKDRFGMAANSTNKTLDGIDYWLIATSRTKYIQVLMEEH